MRTFENYLRKNKISFKKDEDLYLLEDMYWCKIKMDTSESVQDYIYKTIRTNKDFVSAAMVTSKHQLLVVGLHGTYRDTVWSSISDGIEYCEDSEDRYDSVLEFINNKNCDFERVASNEKNF